jgi:hypothetical protein
MTRTCFSLYRFFFLLLVCVNKIEESLSTNDEREYSRSIFFRSSSFSSFASLEKTIGLNHIRFSFSLLENHVF